MIAFKYDRTIFGAKSKLLCRVFMPPKGTVRVDESISQQEAGNIAAFLSGTCGYRIAGYAFGQRQMPFLL